MLNQDECGIESPDTSTCVWKTGQTPCIDSDKGKIYSIKGTFSGTTIEGTPISSSDSCLSSTELTAEEVESGLYIKEGYCDEGELKIERNSCPNGCLDGVCRGTAACEDTDGGKNYVVKGTASGSSAGGWANIADTCIEDVVATTGVITPIASSNYLKETFCSGNQIVSEVVQCPEGCEDGKCKTSENLVKYCRGGFSCNQFNENPENCAWAASSFSTLVDFNKLDLAEYVACTYDTATGICSGDTSCLVLGEDETICNGVSPCSWGLDIPLIPGGSEEVTCTDSCKLDNDCYKYGYRKSGNYCSEISGIFKPQKVEDRVCENNFECESNMCADGACVQAGLISQIIEYLKGILGI
jgi:hypothetical protein